MSATIERTSPLTRRVLAPNPGPMTLDGTNSYILGAADAAAFTIVDPGPLDEQHLALLAGVGRIELILVTHMHADHTAGSARLAELTGAAVRALDAAYCVGDGEPLRDGEVLAASGITLEVLATPGHTADSVSFHLPSDGEAGSVLTGDTILGRGSTVIAHPDSTLGDYLASLERLASLGSALVLPGHGPSLPSIAAVSGKYRAHRLQRLDEVRAALRTLDVEPDALVGAAQAALPAPSDELVLRVVALVYPGLETALLPAASASVRAQLSYLAQLGPDA